ncbi:extracellular solute-binding protein, family 5 [Corynebacterium epidermidicanis]|uniref:Extracellular solute-binding protein, family 5 n=1 Tax=Corynebacterium epidermidicanis TaxID=1050174 RepID=A0A0G3GQG0_9CORY|nr:extracellular solute-binding protein, family 5 [Corynebacterium epidermidicanis]
MTLKKSFTVVSAAALAFGLAACGSSSNGDAGGSSDGIVLANGSEPQNPLIPANTTETGGGRIVDMIYSGLVYYDTSGKAHNEMAESIKRDTPTTYTIKLKEGLKFSDGSPI